MCINTLQTRLKIVLMCFLIEEMLKMLNFLNNYSGE
jgi:hypothetical protein